MKNGCKEREERYGIKEPENFVKFIETLKITYHMSSDDINNYLNEKHSSNLKNINENTLKKTVIFLCKIESFIRLFFYYFT